jgi:hypothetical protein
MSSLRDDEGPGSLHHWRENPLSLHHWAILVRQGARHRYYVVYCNHRGTAYPDYLALETDGYSTKVVTPQEAYGRDPGNQFDGFEEIDDDAHVIDAMNLVKEMDSALRTGKESPAYADYLIERKRLNSPMGTMGAMGQYGHGMTPTNGAVGGMGHHNTMADYGHGMTASNNVAGSMYRDTMNHYGHTMNHYGHATFRDMGAAMQ